MDAETFRTFADGTCENIKESRWPVEAAMESNSMLMQLVGMTKEQADQVVGTSVAVVCPEVMGW